MELLLSIDDANWLYEGQNDERLDCRDGNGDMVTVAFEAAQFDRHARWSIDYMVIVRDHRDQIWATIYSQPATEMQDGQDRWSFTRLVDGVEFVVFRRAESYEVTEKYFRYA